MILTATVGFFVGAMIGLRFNIKILAHCSLLAILASGFAAMTGLMFVTSATLYALASIASLQIGYFATLVLTAMGHMKETAEIPVQSQTAADAAERQSPIQSQKIVS